MYATMFKETAVNDFVKLGSNEVEMLETEEKGQETNEQTANAVVAEVIKRIQALIEKIRDAIKNLEEQEITSANDFVDFRNNLLKE
jgi:DNA-binding ferritin-like protein